MFSRLDDLIDGLVSKVIGYEDEYVYKSDVLSELGDDVDDKLLDMYYDDHISNLRYEYHSYFSSIYGISDSDLGSYDLIKLKELYDVVIDIFSGFCIEHSIEFEYHDEIKEYFMSLV